MKNGQYYFREQETGKGTASVFGHDADINQRDQEGNTVLHAVLNPRYSIKTIQKLLNAGADINARNSNGDTPLLVLLQQLNSVLHPGSDDPDYIPFPDSSEEKSIQHTECNAESFFFPDFSEEKSIQHTECDAESFFTEAVLRLLNAGADVNIRNNHGDTPLIIACRYHGGSAILKMLIAAGADVNYRDGNGVTPLMDMLQNTYDGIHKYFEDFEHKGFVSVLPKEQLLQYLKVRLDTAEEMTAKFLDYANTSERSLRLLEASYDLQSVAGVEVLLAAGADVNARDIYGRTPLMYAVQYNIYTYNITQLLEAGADANAKDEHGCTPLMYAAQFSTRSLKIVQLLEAGAEIDAEDHYGRGVFHLLGKRTNEERLRFLPLLTSSAAKWRTQDKLGYTPWAYWSLRDSGCSDLLLTAGNFIYCLFPGWKHVKAVKNGNSDPTFQMMLDRAEILLEQGGDLQLMRSEFVKAENEVPPQEDEHFRYFNFPSVFALILYKNFNPHAKELRLADRDYGRFYFLYSKLQGNDETLLKKAIAWNPYCAAYWFEYAELLKQQGNLQRLREVLGQMFEFLNDRQDIGTAYQYLGYYYEQQKMYELAACLYRFSMVYDGNDFAARDKLAELSCASGINFKYRHWKIDEIKDELKKSSLPTGASNTVLETAYQWWMLALEKKAYDIVYYFKNIYHCLR